MRLIALETSGSSGSLALFEGNEAAGITLHRSVDLPGDRRTAQTLAPAMKQALADAGWRPGSLGLVAVAQGPGSFTGLRIGVTTAKALAYATGAKLVGVSTLAVLASQANIASGRVWAVLDAQRRELFAQTYAAGDDPAMALDEARVVGVDDWLRELQPGEAVTGPILGRLRDRLPGHVHVVDEALWAPTASTVGELSWRRFLEGQLDDVWRLAPRYYRRSAAEEKWKEK